MLAFLQYLLALMATAEVPGVPWTGVHWIPGLLVLAAGAGAAAVAGVVVRAKLHGADERLSGAILGASADAGRIASLLAFALWAQPCGGRGLDRALGIDDWPFVSVAVRLIPFLGLRTLWRIALHGPAARVGAAPESLLAWISFAGRTSLLALLPALVLTGVQESLARADASTAWGRLWLEVDGAPAAAILFSLATMAALLLVLPFALRFLWKTTPLPPGPLRDRFEAYAKRIGLRANDILVWHTGGGHANAAVVGALPGFRYVFVTDALIDLLDPDEAEAVFAHEAGHAVRHHVPLLLGLTSIVALLGLVPGGFGEALGALFAGMHPLVFLVLFVALWLGGAVGWVSRRFEQEADVFAVETGPAAAAGGEELGRRAATHPLARALLRIAEDAGADAGRHTWRHFSIASRAEFIESYVRDPAVRDDHRARLRRIRWTLVAAVALGFGAALARLPQDLRGSRDRRVLDALAAALDAKPGPGRAAAFAAAARAAVRAGRPEEALRWFAEAHRIDRAARVAASIGGPDGGPRLPPDVTRDWRALLEVSGRPLSAAAATVPK